MAEDVAGLALVVDALLIADPRASCEHFHVAVVDVGAARGRDHVGPGGLIRRVHLFVLVLQHPLRHGVGGRIAGELSSPLLRVAYMVGAVLPTMRPISLRPSLPVVVCCGSSRLVEARRLRRLPGPQLLAGLVKRARRRSDRVLLIELLRLVLEVEIHAVGGDVEDLLRVHLLLLMQRYLVVELLEQLLWIREDVILVEVLLVLRSLLSGFLFEAGVDHGLVLGEGGQLVVVVVAIELGLDGVPAQVLGPLDEVWVFQIFPFLADVLLVVVVVRGRNERCPQLLLVQILPRKVCEPRMVFDVLAAVVAESVLRLSLNHLIDEISCLNVPTFWNLIFIYMCLFRKYIIMNLFSSLALIRSAAKHALPGDDTYCKVVCSNTMVIFAHDLWSHIAWSATCFITVFHIWDPFSGNTEIC